MRKPYSWHLPSFAQSFACIFLQNILYLESIQRHSVAAWRKQAGVLELADEVDSKSSAVMDMPFLPNGLFMRFPEHSFAGAKSRSAILSVIFGGKAQKNFIFAGVSKLANEADSKSAVSNGLWVRVPPPAPRKWLSKPLF